VPIYDVRAFSACAAEDSLAVRHQRHPSIARTALIQFTHALLTELPSLFPIYILNELVPL
jgi:hypothetical protein